MNTLLNFNLDLVGLSILVIIFKYGKINHREQKEQQIFNYLLFASGITLITDIAMWGLEGTQNAALKIILNISTFLFFMMTILLTALWLVYCDHKVNDKKNAAIRQRLYFIPSIICVFLFLINFKTGWIYYYDERMTYQRGTFFSLHILLTIGCMLYSFLMVLVSGRKKSWLQKHDAYSLLSFAIPPFVGALIQISILGVNLIPVSISISLLIIFVQRQTSLITMDTLTGINNRRVFERYLEQRFVTASLDRKLFIMMIDANHFKQINDMYGHSKGDEALIKIANALKSVCIKQDCLARLGGDEFVIIGLRRSEEEIKELCQKIHSEIKKENESGENPYHLSLSIGYSVFDEKKHKNTDEFLHAADQSMYEDKKNQKKLDK